MFILIVTIIVLIILASITILSLTNTKLFSKSREGTDKYKVAQQDEQNTLNEYNSYIASNSRENITISKEEYEKLKLINKPNLWEVGKEYNFQDNVYGQRFMGNMSGNNGYIDLLPYSTTLIWNNMLNYGGIVECSDGIGHEEKFQLGMNYSTSYRFDLCINRRGLELTYVHPKSVNSYDVWVLYTKN